MKIITTIDDLRKIAKKRVPRMFFDYIASGSWTESTLKANTADFEKLFFRQRVAVDILNRTIASQMASQPVTMPIALAPTGLTGMVHADGEILAAQAAEAFGVPFTLSTMSICSIEDVANNSSCPFWFQLYMMRDQEFSRSLIKRAKAVECSALMLTLDLQLMGQRHCDIKNGLSAPPKLVLKNVFDMITKPHWCLNMLKTRRRYFGNIVGHVQGISDMSSLAAWTAEQFDLRLNWEDVKRIRDAWGGKFIIKGIMDPEDAVNALDVGADVIVVSNHGGRQLDGVESSIRTLPKIVHAVGDHMEIWVDGGITKGQDLLKALALGARGALIGRAFLFGLGAYGKDGVTKALEIIYKETDMTMALCGHRDIKMINRQIFTNSPF